MFFCVPVGVAINCCSPVCRAWLRRGDPRYCRHNRPTALIVGVSPELGRYPKPPVGSEPLVLSQLSRYFSAIFRVRFGTFSPDIWPDLSAMTCQPTTEVTPGVRGV